MVRRLSALLLALLLLTGSSLADLKLKEKTPAQKKLKTYLENVNAFLTENGEEEINHIFDQLDEVAELGVTSSDDAYEPENVTVTVYLRYDSIHYLLLRVNDANRFPRIAGAFLRALNPTTMTQVESLKTPAERAGKAIRNPADSFADYDFDIFADKDTAILNGEKPRTFYAYYPNQYHDNVNWMEMMIVFPLPEYWDEELGVVSGEKETKAPSHDPDQAEGYEGYYPVDDYTHLEIFSTPTPEPDSAAAELDDYY